MAEKHDIRGLLAYNLKRLRADRGWSQLTLATEMGMAAHFINAVEHERKWVSAESLRRFCEVLGVEPFQLFLPHDLLVNEKDRSIAKALEEFSGRTAELIDEIRAKYLG